VLVLLLALMLVVLLAIATWQLAPRYNRTLWRRGKPGSVWLHDPTGNVVPEDDEFEKPRDEGDLL
jgi:hypothetical protein